MDDLVNRIQALEKDLISGKELANPGVLSETVVKLNILLGMLINPLSEAELEFKQKRAREYHRLRENLAASAAQTEIRMSEDLIKQEVDIDKIRNFVKAKSNLISTVQSHIRVQESIARGEQ